MIANSQLDMHDWSWTERSNVEIKIRINQHVDSGWEKELSLVEDTRILKYDIVCFSEYINQMLTLSSRIPVRHCSLGFGCCCGLCSFCFKPCLMQIHPRAFWAFWNILPDPWNPTRLTCPSSQSLAVDDRIREEDKGERNWWEKFRLGNNRTYCKKLCQFVQCHEFSTRMT